MTPADKVVALCSSIELQAATAPPRPLQPMFRTTADGVPHIVDGPGMVSALCGVHTRRTVTATRVRTCPTCTDLAVERMTAP